MAGQPWSRKMPDTTHALADVLRGLDAPVAVERQFSMHGQGLTSTFTIGRGYGEILGALAALNLRHDIIRSQDWQKAMLRGESKATGRDLKRQYVAVAERLWPSISFRGPKGGLLDGKAAAALIAEYARRNLF